jgi:hypothetical protein
MNIIILSSSRRMGSTLIQRIFNARDGTLIWGEQNGILKHFNLIYNHMSQFCKKEKEEEYDFFVNNNKNIWTATLCPKEQIIRKAMELSTKTFLDEVYKNNNFDIIGFKEVVYNKNEVELLRKIYPNSKFIFITRNPLDTWKSIINKDINRNWHPTVEHFMIRWNEKSNYFYNYSKNNKNCLFIKFEDIVKRDKEILNKLKKMAKINDNQLMKVLDKKIKGADKDRLRVSLEEKEYILKHTNFKI